VGIYYPLLLLLLKSFNAIAYTFVSVLCLRRLRAQRAHWGGYAYAGLVMSFAVLFLDSLAEEWAVTTLHRRFTLLDLVGALITFLLPALVFHVFYHSERPHLPARRVWATLLAILWSASLVVLIAEVPIGLRSGLLIEDPFFALVAFAVVCVIGILIASRSYIGLFARGARRWMVLLFLVWGGLAVLDPLLKRPPVYLGEDACPLVFVFIVTYYTERLTFFDVLVKKAAFVFSSLLLLTLYFAFVTRWIWAMNLRGWIGTLVWALSVWPIVLWAPWGQRRLSLWVDRLWLGRRFSPAEATRHFLAGLQGAISADELRTLAAQHLSAIFQADVEVLDDAPGLSGGSRPETAIIVPIRLHGEPAGAVRVQPRANGPQLLSEDVALLASLAEAYSFLLENLRLREKRLSQEKREQELVLNASRSELKALRAQVNPHFLFNALNAIAGLIPHDPDRAERTIEQLGEVFRYTLRGSEREWVRLDDELEAVRAYLDVEQARFRDSLQVRLEYGNDVRNVRVPAMIVQTLVENATRHGVGAISTPGIVEVIAAARGETLRIEVRDNGPGFRPAALRALESHDGGYGLRNVRERLQGHFGDSATLRIERDEARGMTVATVEMPLAAVTQPAKVYVS
jgi:GAF domain-containing protein/anti-sigma regulatory factor (Ser/Thr protein kinase)